MRYITEEVANTIKRGRPCYIPQFTDSLFSWEELETIINLSPFLNHLRFHILNGKEYHWKGYYWKTDKSAYPADLVKHEIQHYVCYIQDASRANQKINDIAHELESISHCPTDAHIFFSLTDDESQGLGIHNDISDNFIVQVDGKTNFKVWDIIADEGVHNVEFIQDIPFIDIIMNKGDAIYIPKKYWHHAISKSKRLSVSFPMSPTDDKTFEVRDWINIT